MTRYAAFMFACACGTTPATGPSDASAPDAHDARACSKQPTTLSSQGMPMQLVVDESDIYWLDGFSTAFERTPKTGGQTETLATDVVSFAVDADAVYYVASTYADGGYSSTLYALGKADGGAATALGSFAAVDLAVDATSIYFAIAGSIMSVSKTGGTPQPLTQGLAANRLIGVDATSVYWTSSTMTSSSIWATPKVGGASVVLAETAPIRHAVLDGADIYVTTENRDLLKLSITGSGVTTLATELGQLGGNVAVSAGYVFFDQQDIGQYPAIIFAVPTGGGPEQDTCAGGDMGVTGIASDDTAIYWGLDYEATGELMRIPR